MKYDVLLIGCGVAGMTAAIYLKRSGISCAIFESSMPGGQIVSNDKIENYPGFSSVSGSDLAISILNQVKELEKFLNKFLNKKIELEKSNIWQKDFSNPIEISEIVAAFIDNIHSFNLIMWITLDKNIFIKVSPANSNDIIKYLFERYPY